MCLGQKAKWFSSLSRSRLLMHSVAVTVFSHNNTFLLHLNPPVPVYDFEHRKGVKELYLEITATLPKSSAGQEGEGKAILSFWLAAGIKECTKSARQRPSARDKYTICKTRTVEVYTPGVCTGRMKAHLCSCQYTHGSSRSQMAGDGAVLIRLSGAAKIDNYTPQCQKWAAMHQQK